VVLLVLAIVWGILLVSWLRSRNEGSLADSVGTFRRHLNVLEKAAPYRVAPANRLRGPAPIPAYRPSSRIGPGTPVRVNQVRRSPAAANLRRRQTQKRRRDVFFALLAGVVGSFLLAIIPGLSVMWSVQVLFDVMLVAYVALLIRLRNLAAERELKLRFMPRQTRVAPPRPTYDFAAGYGDLELRRAAN
jgi:hypothetical protein